MEHNKAGGPDCIPIEFYQIWWDFIKDDIMELRGGHNFPNPNPEPELPKPDSGLPEDIPYHYFG